ncbi:phage tail tape measure protein [Agrobacterium vitis]|uniref:phage tail tape measure protein n=1 Tax=Agrobacterium vitis TaxID=373 RepID=UPI001F3B96BD|nr:phage tail tape measure protein [Agrobacterium vitis]MCF1452298.1 phage tail tape measure protein [Agrobacterium vitis]
MANAVIGALRVTLGLDTAAFEKGLASTMKSMKGLGKSMESVGKTLSIGLTAPIAAFGTLTVKTAGDFQAAMNRVEAATGATAAEIAAMQKMAIKLGADTTFSASEAANAMEMLAKNGLTASQIMGGAVEASMKLAAASGGELAASADLVTDVMLNFGKTAKDLNPVIDGITGVMLQSKFGFDDYRLAIAQAGGVAGALGVSFDDFNASLAATSSAFASGSDAGTSMKQFLVSLVPQSEAAEVAMDDLKLKFFETNGSMKSMSAIAEELNSKMSSLSEEQLNDKMKTMFGVDAMRTSIMLMKTGGKGIDELLEKISKASAADQAAARLKGFNGELEQLTGAFESLQIAIANSGLLSLLTEMVKALGDWVAKLAETNPEILKWGTVVAALAAVLGPVAVGIGAVVAVIAAIGAPIALAVAGAAALAAAAVAIYTNWDTIKTQFPTIGAIVEGAIGVISATLTALNANAHAIVAGIVALFTGDFAGAFTAVQQIAHNFADLWLNIAEVIFPGAKAAIIAGVQSIGASMATFGSQIVATFVNLGAEMVVIGEQIMAGLWQGIQNKWQSVKESVTSIASGIKSTFTEFFDINSPSRVMTTLGEYITQGLGDGITNGKEKAVSSAKDVANGVSGALSNIDTAGSGLAKNMDSAFSSIGSGLAEAIKGTKSWGDVAKGILSSLAQSLIGTMGGGGGVGGSLLKGLFSGLTGFANGGTIMPGGNGAGIDSQVVAFRKSPTEQVDIHDPRKSKSSGGGASYYSIDARGADQGAVSRIEAALKKVDGSIEKRAVAAQNFSNKRKYI